jgi:hypothetical protein
MSDLNTAQSIRFWYEADTIEGKIEGTFTLGKPFVLARKYAPNVADTLARLKIVQTLGLSRWHGKARIIRHAFEDKPPRAPKAATFAEAEGVKKQEREYQRDRGILP